MPPPRIPLSDVENPLALEQQADRSTIAVTSTNAAARPLFSVCWLTISRVRSSETPDEIITAICFEVTARSLSFGPRSRNERSRSLLMPRSALSFTHRGVSPCACTADTAAPWLGACSRPFTTLPAELRAR